MKYNNTVESNMKNDIICNIKQTSTKWFKTNKNICDIMNLLYIIQHATPELHK